MARLKAPPGMFGVYNSTLPTLSDQDGCDAQLDANGRLIVVLGTAIKGEDATNDGLATFQKLLASSTYAPSRHSNLGAATKANVKSSTGNVLGVACSNVNAAVRYFQLHNKATAPAATDVPVYSFLIPVNGELIIGQDFFTKNGDNFSTGIGWAISTTIGTFTDSATASEHSVAITYK